MKKMMLVLTGGLVLAFFANCGKNDDGPKGGSAEMSGACYQMSRAGQTTGYGGSCSYPYAATNSGFSSANSTTNFSYTLGYGYAGVAACSGTQSQAYSPSKGMACVVNSQITLSGQPVIYDYNQMTGNFNAVSQPNPNFAYQAQTQLGYQSYPYGMSTQVSYLPATATQTFRVCDAAESCPTGQTCRSPLGPYAVPNGLGICYF